jgi:hypothetical protein
MKYHIDHVVPTWHDDDYKNLQYEYLPHKDQAMVDRWIHDGYQHMNLNGAVVNEKNSIPAWANTVLQKLNWQETGVNLYRMNTGDILPTHSDHYITYQRIHSIGDPSTIWRCVVFMEDWKSGHYFEIDKTPLVNWQAGDYVVWNYDVPHMAANIGPEPRYTMQITGIVC